MTESTGLSVETFLVRFRRRKNRLSKPMKVEREENQGKARAMTNLANWIQGHHGVLCLEERRWRGVSI
jgi:hypothetical protein